MNRVENSIKNLAVGSIGQVITIVLGFISRSLFLTLLSIDYLGASSLFSNILMLLSFAELGVGTAIVYSLYKPLAEKDDQQILALMNLYKKAYKIIGATVLIAGISLTPFLDFFVPDRKGIENLEWIFILYVINTASSYFFVYNRSLITADQKEYKLFKLDLAFKIISTVLPITGLYITKNYFVFLVIQIATSIVGNYLIQIKVRKEYPLVLCKDKPILDSAVKKAILKNVSALLIYKLAVVLTAGTDNILLSRFFGLTVVGLYSNYYLIINYANSIISQGIKSITASIGNVVATESNDKKYEVFNTMFFVNFWTNCFISICFLMLTSPFITVWLGGKYVMDIFILIPICLSAYQVGIQNVTSSFRDAEGLFWQGKLRPLAQAIANIGLSMLFIYLTKSVAAVFWGTVVSRLITTVWFDPYIVFKYSLHKPLSGYFVKRTIYNTFTVAVAGLCWLIGSILTLSPWPDLLLKMAICILIPNIAILIVFHRTKECKYLMEIAKSYKNKAIAKIPRNK
ncbi:MAG: hypothetical protein PHY23_03260 [Oscillospiraceae bacterium]|jgi:O-antigen/teichoic acid export membrane protein|nr:hypothetical protein [Oscillospiraceae bacterium]